MKTAWMVAAAVAAMLAGSAGRAHGEVISFEGLVGNNGDPFTGPYLEGAFEVEATSGIWREGHFFGNTIPAVFSTFGDSPTGSSVTVVNTGSGYFTFNSVDMANGGGTAYGYTIEGFLGASLVFTTSSSSSGAVFTTIASPDPVSVIDRLVITEIPTGGFSVSLDNINVVEAAAPVPEASAVLGPALFGLVIGFAVRRRLMTAA